MSCTLMRTLQPPCFTPHMLDQSNLQQHTKHDMFPPFSQHSCNMQSAVQEAYTKVFAGTLFKDFILHANASS